MASFGKEIEDRLIGYLKGQQFDVAQDPILDHEFKIDFVIRHFPRIPKFQSLGVQITTKLGDISKMAEFANVHSGEYRVVDKVVYLEIDPTLDFDKGGVGHLIATGLSEFQFNTAHIADKMTGIKINRDLTYSMYDISTMLARLSEVEMKNRNASQPPKAETEVTIASLPSRNPPTPSSLPTSSVTSSEQKKREPQLTVLGKNTQGYINAYYRTKDHGFITAQNGESYFFGLSGVSDGVLRDKLLALPHLDWAATVDGTVEFEDVGRTRSNARYPEAKAVRAIK